MITIYLMGGLGNQLFQIAHCMAYALRNKKAFFFTYSDQLLIGEPRPTYWNNFLKHLKSFTKEVIPNQNQIVRVNEPQFEYINYPQNMDNIEFFGYFQSYKYFEDQFANILKLIRFYTFRDSIFAKFPYKLNKPIISLHIRLGDYKHKQQYHPVMPVSYYVNALKHILKSQKSTDFSVLYFYELDDIELVNNDYLSKLKTVFPDLNFISVDNNLEDWEQMVLMSCCSHNIIANSSFSWWGAYLNQNENKIVCYPETWFGPSMGNKKLDDLFPKNWVKVKL